MQGVNLVFTIIILILSVVAHEVSHGYAAYLMGDSTAKRAGRLSMNPFRHLDMVGSFIVPLALILLRSSFVFGWAKPVPYNPHNLRNQKWGPGLVGASGPFSNFLIAGFFAIVNLLLPLDLAAKQEIGMAAITGAGIFGAGYVSALFYFSATVIWINLFLGIFNLIPIPPLDGSKLLFSFLPYKWSNAQSFLERYGFFILIFFIFYFSSLLLPVIFLLYRFFLGI
ncbi:site-2 protease family protein [Candidatus Parcubacteria bacterium]|nr:MAG: site-2 protease family protein [Candidatus Parcubacteria bacterium]